MPLIDDVKAILRISAGQTAFNIEIQDLIDAAIDDLKLSGVVSEKADDGTDSLIRRAVFTYVKAYFGWDNPDADRLQKAYGMLKMHLTLSQEYTGFAVTFTVTDGLNPLEDAVVTLNGTEMITNTLGKAMFAGITKQQNMEYTVTLEGYEDIEDEVDVEGSISVPVTMVVI